MFEVKFCKLSEIDSSLFTRVVCVCRYKNKWVYCKHKDRQTWEIPGGHIESGESWQEAIKRELYEETGAVKFEVEPICVYKISSYGLLCFAEIKELKEIPKEFEIEKICMFDKLPRNLTYPDTHTKMFEIVNNLKG